MVLRCKPQELDRFEAHLLRTFAVDEFPPAEQGVLEVLRAELDVDTPLQRLWEQREDIQVIHSQRLPRLLRHRLLSLLLECNDKLWVDLVAQEVPQSCELYKVAPLLQKMSHHLRREGRDDGGEQKNPKEQAEPSEHALIRVGCYHPLDGAQCQTRERPVYTSQVLESPICFDVGKIRS